MTIEEKSCDKQWSSARIVGAEIDNTFIIGQRVGSEWWTIGGVVGQKPRGDAILVVTIRGCRLYENNLVHIQ